MSSQISRRRFLTGAAVTGAAAALGGLAGCSSSNSGSAPAASASTPAVQTAGWLGEAPVIADGEITETLETDILIVGAGNAGLVSAASAADLGEDFIIADKSKGYGGVHNDIGAINSKYTEAAGTMIDKGMLLNEMSRYASFKNDQRVVKAWIDNSAEMIDWLDTILLPAGGTCTLDIEPGAFNERAQGGTYYYMVNEKHGYGWADPGAHAEDDRFDRQKILVDYLTAKGHDIMFEHDLVELVKDGDKVTGAIFAIEGGYSKITANKGVILACGGYPANPEMIREIAPLLTSCVTSNNYNPMNTGQGIKAAMWAGATKDIEPAYMVFDRGACEPGTNAGYTDDSETAQFAVNGQLNIGSQPFLKVDRDGNRICNESANYDAICFAASSHKGGVWCEVFDSNAPEDTQRFATQGCSAGTRKVLSSKSIDEAYGEKYLDKGIMMKADTLEELADKLGFADDDKTNFLATVDNYNTLYDKGEDHEFGKESYRLSEIRTAPFYGCWFGGALLTTLDGIRINEYTQALDANDEPIEGLHVVGTCSGSFYSGNYPVYIVGDCLGRQLTFGRRAALYLAGQIAE